MVPRKIVFICLIAATIGLMALRMTTTYSDLAVPATIGRALGYAAFPWLVGLVVGVLAARSKKGAARQQPFFNGLLGAVAVMLLIQVAITLFR